MTSWKKDGFVINTDKQYLNLHTIHQFLSEESYWAKGISFESVQKAVDHSSICFGIYQGSPEEGNAAQVGFARVLRFCPLCLYYGRVCIAGISGRGIIEMVNVRSNRAVRLKNCERDHVMYFRCPRFIHSVWV